MRVISENEFENEIKEGVVLVDFFATWCGPCRMMSMILEEIEEEVKDKAKIVKVDVDESEELARKFGVMSIPTLILFVDGKMYEKHIGLWQKDQLLELLNSF
jgi:thioredoxin 1